MSSETSPQRKKYGNDVGSNFQMSPLMSGSHPTSLNNQPKRREPDVKVEQVRQSGTYNAISD